MSESDFWRAREIHYEPPDEPQQEFCQECSNLLTTDEEGDGICYACGDALYGDDDE